MKNFFSIIFCATLCFFAFSFYVYASEPTLQQKVGQMLIVGFRGTSVATSSSIVKAVNDLNIGGVLLFDYDSQTGTYNRNIKNPAQVKSLISNLKKFTNNHMFVSVDLEGGQVNRLKSKYGFTNFPSAQSLGTKGDLVATKKVGADIGNELSKYGFNMDFAPDADVNVNPKNPIIGGVGRSFSNDPAQVVAEARAFIDGLHSAHMISVIKHFPGHGSSTSDSHLGFVDITKTYQQKELLPFQNLVNDADAIMVAHVTNTNIDPKYPASLSSLFIQDILRKQLGYSGVVISDDMDMGAISQNYTYKNAIIRAINAGNDMLIISNNGGRPYNDKMPYNVSKIITDAVSNGQISIDTINSTYARIEKLKSDFKI